MASRLLHLITMLLVANNNLEAVFPRKIGAQHWFCAPGRETRLICSGLAVRNPSEVVSPRTTFHCFSATKTVTALAVVQLVSEGRVDLDAPLTRYLNGLPYQNGATVRQVLSHQAGLPNPMPLSWVHTDESHASFSASAFVEKVLREFPKCAPAGEQVRYSNIGFLLLGRLIEAVSGLPYEQFVRQRILDVVAPDSAPDAYLGFEIPPGRHATGYTRRWSGLGLLVSVLPDAAHLRSSDHGWIRYRPFHLNGSAYGGLKGNALGWAPLLSALAARDRRLLPPRGYDALFAPQSLANGTPTGHALSWFTGRTGGHDYLCHAGGGPGYAAEVRLYPSLRAASVSLSNTTLVSDKRLLDRLDSAWLPSARGDTLDQRSARAAH